MPFTNQLARSAGLATNYFAVAHPSLTNYLEIVGGSNFGVLNDHSPDWHNANCLTNLSSGQPSLDESSYPNICRFAAREPMRLHQQSTTATLKVTSRDP